MTNNEFVRFDVVVGPFGTDFLVGGPGNSPPKCGFCKGNFPPNNARFRRAICPESRDVAGRRCLKKASVQNGGGKGNSSKPEGCHPSGQIIVISHDLTPNGGLVREIPLFQGNLGW